MGMVGEDDEGRTLRRWRFLWWHYAIAVSDTGPYAEVRGSVFGTDITVRHSWAKWNLLVVLSVVFLATVVICCAAVTAVILGYEMTFFGAFFILIMWMLCALNARMVYLFVYHTRSVRKNISEDSLSPYR